ncbi:MAG: flagellar basal body-associated FliL family protein [Acidobacteria bacterium]|nr:flagellar basal body-associated FliL family protein [Acidobacteriota bacterium]
MNKMVIIGIVAAAVLIGGGAAAYFFFAGGEGEAEVAEEIEEPAGVLELETFLTNLNDPSGSRHARLQVKLGIAPETVIPELEADTMLVARLRDQVLTLVNSKTPAELATPDGKEAFRKQIYSRLKPLIVNGDLKEVFFSDFVVK